MRSFAVLRTSPQGDVRRPAGLGTSPTSSFRTGNRTVVLWILGRTRAIIVSAREYIIDLVREYIIVQHRRLIWINSPGCLHIPEVRRLHGSLDGN